MKKVILGLFLAGTMMSFTNDSEELKTVDDYGTCCTAYGGGTSATRCTDFNGQAGIDVACGLASAALELAILANDDD